jgi:hypothetical protein
MIDAVTMVAIDLGCVKTSPSREYAELLYLSSSPQNKMSSCVILLKSTTGAG